MNIILLSGGSGKRLWPLSNDIRSKQFVKFFRREDGEYESMLQRMYRQILEVDPAAEIVIASAKSQVSAIHNQIGEEVGISVEPCRRDTFPAIALATAYLLDVKGVSPDESVVVCPIDPYVEGDYFRCLAELDRHTSEANLVLMGIEPTYPSEKYGYIIPCDKKPVSRVSCFKEKPDKETAEKYIRRGALWNGGVFAFRLGYLSAIAHKLIDFKDHADLFAKYESLTKISFDYAVVEKETDIKVVRFNGQWKDIGTWNTLTESISDPVVGRGILNKTENVHIINELDVPIVVCGISDAVVSASPEGILVSDKSESSFIKPIVDRIEQQVMFAEKSWGSYRVVNVEEESLTVKITLNAGHSMNYHSHRFRNEIWVVIAGSGEVTVDGETRKIAPGDVVTMKAGAKHTVLATEKLMLIEIQLGRDISVHDKIKFPPLTGLE